MKKFKVSWIPVLVFTISTIFLMSSCGTGGTAGPVSPAGEVEATEYLGTRLTPIKEQGNNALRGTQIIDRDTYILTIDGLVDKPLALTYDQLLEYPQES